MSLLELIASGPPSRPRNGTTSSRCSSSLASLMECASSSRRPPSSHSTQFLQPRAQLLLPVGQRVRLCFLGGLGKPESRQHQASEVHFFFPLVSVHKTTSTSCRRSLMKKWRNCTLLHSKALTQEQADYIGVKIGVPFKGGHHRCWIQASAEGVIACVIACGD